MANGGRKDHGRLPWISVLVPVVLLAGLLAYGAVDSAEGQRDSDNAVALQMPTDSQLKWPLRVEYEREIVGNGTIKIVFEGLGWESWSTEKQLGPGEVLCTVQRGGETLRADGPCDSSDFYVAAQRPAEAGKVWPSAWFRPASGIVSKPGSISIPLDLLDSLDELPVARAALRYVETSRQVQCLPGGPPTCSDGRDTFTETTRIVKATDLDLPLVYDILIDGELSVSQRVTAIESLAAYAPPEGSGEPASEFGRPAPTSSS